MICKYCNKDLNEKYFEHFIDSKGRIHKRAMCCYCRSEYWKKYYKEKGEEYSKNDITKEGQRALQSARIGYGAKMGGEKGASIKITPKEWEAIQAGAISNNKLVQIINNSDLDKLKELATPRTAVILSDSKKAMIKSRSASGYTLSDIADSLGISTTTVQKVLSGKEE